MVSRRLFLSGQGKIFQCMILVIIPAVLTAGICGCGDNRSIQSPQNELAAPLTGPAAAVETSIEPASMEADAHVEPDEATSAATEFSPPSVHEPKSSVEGSEQTGEQESPSAPPEEPSSDDVVKPAAETADSNDIARDSQGTRLPADLLEGSKLTPLNPQKTVLLDLAGKRVLLRARVCLTQGLLEMLLCPHQTKEHESILSTEAQAFTVHTGLLALGCKEGQAAKYDPETETYTPASGQVIDIFLHWVDADGRLRRERAQNWIRHSRQRYYEARFETLPADLTLEKDGNLRYDEMNQVIFWYGPMSDQQRDECLTMSTDRKFQEAIRRFHKESQERPMAADWVFVGSGFYQDGDSARQYLAEGGYMICVANFAMAMIDVAISSDSNGTESLAYEAATERIPPRDSEVLIELVPRPMTAPSEQKLQESVPPEDKPESTSEHSSEPKNTDVP